MTAAGREQGFTPAEDLLLRSLLAPEPEARRSCEQWLASVDLDSLDPTSLAVLPGLHARLRQLGMEPAAAPVLKGLHRHHWYRNRLQFRAALASLRVLEREGLAAVAWGGVVSLPLHHGDWGGRRLDAIDLAVTAADAAEAARLLERMGWGRTGWGAEHLTEAFLAARSRLTFRDASGFELRMHWRLCDWRLPCGAGAADWAPGTAEIDSEEIRVLGATELLVLAVAVEPAEAVSPSLVWAVDAAVLAAGGEVDWERVALLARRQGVSSLVGRRVAWLHEMVGTAVAGVVVEGLVDAGGRGETAVVSLHRPGAAVGPALYRMLRHLVRCRRLGWRHGAYRGIRGFMLYLRQVHGLARRRDVPSYFLRSAVGLWRGLRGDSSAGSC